MKKTLQQILIGSVAVATLFASSAPALAASQCEYGSKCKSNCTSSSKPCDHTRVPVYFGVPIHGYDTIIDYNYTCSVHGR